MKTTLVSVYLATKNREALLREAVSSVLTQTYSTVELIVVNDGSTDGTGDFLEDLQVCDKRVRIIHNAESIGAPRSRNVAVQSACGEFVTGLDDDDRFHPHRIGAFVEYWKILERAGETFSCLYSQDIVEKANQRVFGVKPGAITWQDLFFSNGIGNQVFARRETFLAAGLFDDQMPAWQDLDLFIRILRHAGPARLLDAALYITNLDPRADRISIGSKKRILDAYRKLEAKWADCPRIMRQGLYLQAFGHYYGFKPCMGDLLAFFRMGIHLRTLKTLAGIYLRRA
jgi:glycosyltransferase involved in cell wall biosynthesis